MGARVARLASGSLELECNMRWQRILRVFLFVSMTVTIAFTMDAGTHAGRTTDRGPQGNILLLIIDDAGFDQLTSFNYDRRTGLPNAIDPARTPTLDAIARRGVRFMNTWAMPDCSPSRSTLFTGRYPMRTGVMNACLPSDLPVSQVSPYEVTIAEILEDQGYQQHYVGKWHLGDPTLNPAGPAMTFAAGFPSFDGTPYGGPAFIDRTLAGQLSTDAQGIYSCGFPIDPFTNEPAICACAYASTGDGDDPVPQWTDARPGFDAIDCLASGGVPMVESNGEPIMTGSADAWSRIEFTDSATDSEFWNGYYVMPRAQVDSPEAILDVQRGYATTLDTDRAIDWMQNERMPDRPWFLTVSYESIHTPYQQAPNDLRIPGRSWPRDLPQVCASQNWVSPGEVEGAQRELTRQMLEGIDLEVRRLLVDSEVAVFEGDELVSIDPSVTIIMIGDNGTYYPSVEYPFDFARAKATVYQTGVSVPLSVTGSIVEQPGRINRNLVNIADLFVLLGELAGVDVLDEVPPTHIIDGKPMLRYLVDAGDVPPARTINFAQLGENQHPLGTVYGPCVFESLGVCTDSILFSQSLCEDSGGVWYGPGSDFDCGTSKRPLDCATCLQLEDAPGFPETFTILPLAQEAVTDGRFKLIQNHIETDSGSAITFEFYDLRDCPAADRLPGELGIDYGENAPAGLDCSLPLDDLGPIQTAAFLDLYQALQDQLQSEIPCPGDGNLDKRVDAADIGGLLQYWGPQSSVYDLNQDAVTDVIDLGLLLVYWNPDCTR
ncbi:sulfatase-like hydrolase/transferase [bacterium]|nr:sulfatase-like hydrolase/transferase [bacterium]